MSNINFTYTFSDPGPNTILTSVAYANNGDPNTTNAILPSTVVTIATEAFSNGSARAVITSLNCSNALGLTTIDNYPFYNCGALTSITGISSVTSIGSEAFRGCNKLLSFAWPSGAFSIRNQTFFTCSVLTSITGISSVTSIGSQAFFNCFVLTSFGDISSVASIEADAFRNCSTFTSFAWPSGAYSINETTFFGCSALTSIGDISSVTSIGSQAFSSCSALTSIGDISSVTSIGSGAFYNCNSLTSFAWPSGAYSISDGTFAACSALTGFGNISSVTSIGSAAFQQCGGLRSFSWPSGAFSIGSYTFFSCQLLTSITGISSVTSIESDAFNDCRTLRSFSWPSGAFSISNATFGYCSALTSFVVPSSVTIVGANAFYDCTGLTSITLQRLLIDVLTILDPSSFRNTTSINTTNYGSLTNMILQGYSSTDLTTAGFDPAAVTLAEAASLVCFKEDTKILTDKGYIPIQNLRKGDLVKTFLNDYKPIVMIGKKYITHIASQQRIKDQLYKCSQTEYPEIIEPLIITGCHSILVDDFISETQKKRVIEINKNTYVTDDKYRLPACADDRASVYEIPGSYTIYHLALENENYYYNYGIYANGLLVESCSKRYLKEKSNMILID